VEGELRVDFVVDLGRQKRERSRCPNVIARSSIFETPAAKRAYCCVS
jgi:hypothetical protein